MLLPEIVLWYIPSEQFLWYTRNTHYDDTVGLSSDSLLTVRQLLVTVKQSSTMPSTSELCNSLHFSLKTRVDKATSQEGQSVTWSHFV